MPHGPQHAQTRKKPISSDPSAAIPVTAACHCRIGTTCVPRSIFLLSLKNLTPPLEMCQSSGEALACFNLTAWIHNINCGGHQRKFFESCTRYSHLT